MCLLLKEQREFHQERARYHMSTGKIEVWIIGRESLCRVSQKAWEVCLLDCCNRQPVVFCDRKLCAETKCGTVDFEVPPGCYFVRARAIVNPDQPPDIAFGVATVGCGQQVCITLVSPFAFLARATEEERQMFSQELEKLKATPGQQPPTT